LAKGNRKFASNIHFAFDFLWILPEISTWILSSRFKFTQHYRYLCTYVPKRCCLCFPLYFISFHFLYLFLCVFVQYALLLL